MPYPTVPSALRQPILRIVARSAPHERRSVILGLVVFTLRKVILQAIPIPVHADRRQSRPAVNPFAANVLASPDNSLVPSPTNSFADQAQQLQRARPSASCSKSSSRKRILRLRARQATGALAHSRRSGGQFF